MARLSPQSAAYGFRYTGIDPTPFLGLSDAAGWPPIRVQRLVCTSPTTAVPGMTDDRATAVTPAGVLRLDRARQTLSIASPATLALSDVVHPGLWPAAAIFARWRGLETLHAGAFLDGGGGAWAIMADSGTGKSSLLAALALRARRILVDDLVVIDGAYCFAGPRCIDLRPEAAQRLGLVDRTEPVRSTSRCRLTLDPCPGRARLAGFIELAWGEEVSVQRLAPSAALAGLARHRRVLGLGADLHELLDLAGLPMFRLSRPLDWSAQPQTIAALMHAVDGG